MLKLRTDIAYVGQMGKFTQAGVEAIQGLVDANAAADAELGVRVTAIETELDGSLIKPGTAVAAASQTSIDFTGIPAWVRRVTLFMDGLSTNGTSAVLIQIGDSGGVETTNYRGASTFANAAALATVQASSGAQVEAGSGLTAAALRNGTIFISKVDGNTWSISGTVGQSQATGCTYIAVNKTLSDVLDRVRVTTVGGTDTFDAGSANISWE